MEHLNGEHESERDAGSVATLPDSHNERGLSIGLPVVVILGPTATGKSGLALSLAERFDGEVVSCDSRYFYRGMDIGTAKPSDEDLGRIPHHVVDILDPGDDYSLARFLDDAYRAVEEVGGRGRLPIVAGGTPLYLKALLQGWRVPRVEPDYEFREQMESVDAAELYHRVREVDSPSAERIGCQNRRRLIRALEVHRGAGVPMSELEGKDPPPYRFLILGLTQERDQLYARIDRRARWMFTNGILDEARMLIEKKIPPDTAAMSAIGYPEARAVVTGDLSLDEAIEQTCFATHRYVRHQETWFRRFRDVTWLDSSDEAMEHQAADLVRIFLADQPGDTG